MYNKHNKLKYKIISNINLPSKKIENFIIKNLSNDNDWYFFSRFQKLSESFIEKFKNKLYWYEISIYQKLSESFIERFKDKVNWNNISKYQKLSESFIEKFQNKVDWYYISMYQKLSESFIEKFKDYVDWNLISKYQNLSNEFRNEYNLDIPKNNTMYMTKQEINKLIPNCYEREGEYIIAYKNIRKDRYSHFNFQYKYEKGGIYECHCDCNNHHQNSFGLSLWTEKKAKDFHHKGIVVRCRVKLEDIGAIVHQGNKLRCKRIEVLN